MKIVFLVPSLGSGGAERTTIYLSDNFSKSGHDVEIVNISDHVFYEIPSFVKYNSLKVSSKCSNIFERFSNIVKRYSRVNKAINEANPNVVVSLLPETAKYILRLHKRKSFVLITSERNNPELDGNMELKRKIFHHCDGIVFQTERAKTWYPKEISEKGVVIHNAVGNELVYKVGAIEQRRKLVSAAGRLVKQKDYPTLLKAFKLVLEKYPDYILDIYGDGPDANDLKLLASELEMSSNVNFMGVHKDAILQIADSACYVMSSIHEGMPNALMEAMAVGLPCVSTDCPNGPAELILNEVNGLLVPVGDENRLAKAIIRMIEDKDFAEKCGKNAKLILETHSVKKIAKDYMGYIESVVKHRNDK